MKHDRGMTTTIVHWLELMSGETRRSMALRIGQTPSTFNRNVGTPEVLIAVSRAYGFNPVEALIAGGIVTRDEANAFGSAAALKDVSEKELLLEMLRRVEAGGSEELTRPITSDDLEDALAGDPDYSNMSERDAKDYDLAASAGEKDIEHDASPHEP